MEHLVLRAVRPRHIDRPTVRRPRDRVRSPSLPSPLTLILPFFLDLVPGRSVHMTSALGLPKGLTEET